MATAIFNLALKRFDPSSLKLNYFLALFFGLIHGLGFANSIRFMLSKDQHIAWPLLSFNIGLELGQIVLVTGILTLAYLLVNKAGLKRTWWVWLLSGIALILSTQMAIQRWPF